MTKITADDFEDALFADGYDYGCEGVFPQLALRLPAPLILLLRPVLALQAPASAWMRGVEAWRVGCLKAVMDNEIYRLGLTGGVK